MVPLPQHKRKCSNALKKCEHDPYIFVTLASVFCHHGKVDKIRNWLDRTLTLAPDIGDSGALYYKFELQRGTKENENDELKRCDTVEPKHGEKWQTISKAAENAHEPTDAILKKVVIALRKEENVGDNKH